jgi:putrescine transport system substrate-binding protein
MPYHDEKNLFRTDHIRYSKILSLILPFLVLLVCSAEVHADDAGILHLYNWGDYVPAELIEGFEQETGIRVYYNVYENDVMLDSKLLTGYTGYDLVGIAELTLQRFLPIGVFQPLERERLHNLKNLDPEMMQRLAFSDPGNRHAVPYFWGSIGIAYNVDLIRERMPDAPLTSAAMIFDPAVISRFADCGVSFLDDPTGLIRMALVYLGYDLDDTSEEAFAAAERLLKSVRPYVRYFDSNRVAIDLPAEEICMTVAWNGDFGYGLKTIEEEALNVNLAYFVPDEGSYIWMDTWSMLADAPNSANAYLFLDYLMRPKVMAAVSNNQRYPNSNLASRPFLIPQITDDPAVTHPPEIMQRLGQRTAYDIKTTRRANRIWARVKAGFE